MFYKTGIEPYTLRFKKPAGTSRGTYQTRTVWFVRLSDPENPDHWGVGECAPLPGLSCDAVPGYEDILQEACRSLETTGSIDGDTYRAFPSILFGLETALIHFKKKSYALWDTPFSKSKKGIPINGLIWMGTYENMAKQLEEKLQLGFRCIKLKIGAIGFEEEFQLLKRIRKRFSTSELTLRVDANGAFTPKEALEKLCRLHELGIHSIEQPIHSRQWENMAELTERSPLPIALDEELIGWHTLSEKQRLLNVLKPRYVVLKPSLHGGIKGCTDWINLANAQRIGWWLTSALESNIGLNAIAQWCATLNTSTHQGLGTGQLYVNNIDIPLCLEGEQLWFKP